MLHIHEMHVVLLVPFIVGHLSFFSHGFLSWFKSFFVIIFIILVFNAYLILSVIYFVPRIFCFHLSGSFRKLCDSGNVQNSHTCHTSNKCIGFVGVFLLLLLRLLFNFYSSLGWERYASSTNPFDNIDWQNVQT